MIDRQLRARWRAQEAPAEPGPDSICFVCAPCDAAVGLRVILALRQRGWRVWFDRALFSGAEWSGPLSDAVELCAGLVLLYSDEAYDFPLIWNCFAFARGLKKPRLILHLDEREGQSISADGDPRQQERWADPAGEDFSQLCDPRWTLSLAAPCPPPCHDLAARIEGGDPGPDPVRFVNLRSHEAWNRDREFLKILSGQELKAIRSASPLFFRFVTGKSFTRDHPPEPGQHASPKTEGSSPRDPGPKPAGSGPFPEGYPYMDEFEYLDSLWDD